MDFSDLGDIQPTQGIDFSDLGDISAPPKQTEASMLGKIGNYLATSKALPISEGIAGAVLGGGIPGAALGGAAGEAQRQLLARGMGLPVPQTSLSAAKDIGVQGALQGGGEAVGQYVLTPAMKAAAPYVAPFAKGLANQAESLVGAESGSISRAFHDPSLMFGPGTKAITPIYEAAKEQGGPMRPLLRDIGNPKELVDASLDILKSGDLTPTEALAARQALDQVKKRVTNDYFVYARDLLNSKAKEVFSVADSLYQRAIQSESLRNLLPQNKLGGASAFKLGIAAALEGVLPGWGKLAPMALSPAAWGAGATGLGIAARTAGENLIEHPQIGLGLMKNKEEGNQ